MRLVMSGKTLNNIFESAGQYREEGLLKINDDRILIKVMDSSESAQFACLIPEHAMYEFDDRGVQEIAVNYDTLTDFIPSSDIDVEMEYGQFNKVNKLIVRYGGSEVRVPTITKGDVPDVQTSIPDFDMPVKVTADPDFMLDFIKKCDKIGTDHFMMSPREGLFYLYGRKDDSEVIERIPWEDFVDYDIDWNKGNVPDPSNVNNPTDPSETHEVDVMLSCDLAGAMSFWADMAVFHIDNHLPIKAVFEDDNGIKASWMLAPRLPTDGEVMKLPENVVEQRGLEEMMA